MIAFKTWGSNPNNNFSSLDQYPWQVEQIPLEKIEEYIAHGWSVVTYEQFETYKQDHSQELVNYEQEIKNNQLRVFDLVDDSFQHLHPSKIDFTLHLKKNILLTKKVTMSKSGRPMVAKYYYPEQQLDTNLICQIDFEFVDNASRFMIERKEWLGYINYDGNIPEKFLIHHRKYDFTSIQEARISLQERVEARNNIIQEIKIVAQQVLITKYVTEGSSMAQAAGLAIQNGSIFFNEFKNDVDSFIQVASPEFKSKVLNNTSYSWLNNYAAPNVTLRLFIVDRLTY